MSEKYNFVWFFYRTVRQNLSEIDLEIRETMGVHPLCSISIANTVTTKKKRTFVYYNSFCTRRRVWLKRYYD